MASRRDNLPKAFRIVPCTRCGEEFQSTGPNSKRCEPCRLEHKREYEAANKRAKNWRPAACSRCGGGFPPDVHAHTRYCQPCSVAARNEAAAATVANDPERARAIALRFYKKNRDRILEKRRQPDERRKITSREKIRRDNNPGLRLHGNVSRLVSMALNGAKAGRKWQTLVGYTLDDLKRHLERQFVKGMTWQNYGSAWHVDHIRPRASFSFISADDPDFKACWALTNLQPLWAPDNLSKGAKIAQLV